MILTLKKSILEILIGPRQKTSFLKIIEFWKKKMLALKTSF